MVSFNNYSLSSHSLSAPRTQEGKDLGSAPAHTLVRETDSKLCGWLRVAETRMHGGRKDLGWRGGIKSSVLTMSSLRCLLDPCMEMSSCLEVSGEDGTGDRNQRSWAHGQYLGRGTGWEHPGSSVGREGHVPRTEPWDTSNVMLRLCFCVSAALLWYNSRNVPCNTPFYSTQVSVC